MTKRKKNTPALGPEFCQIFKRKAGAHSHKNVKRKKTRQKFLRLERIMREYQGSHRDSEPHSRHITHTNTNTPTLSRLRVLTEKIIYLSFFVDKSGRMRDNTVMKLSDKKKNEIKVLAKYLRQELDGVDALRFAVKELFKGEGSIELDNDGQVMIYTGHKFDEDSVTKALWSVSCIDFLHRNYLESRKD